MLRHVDRGCIVRGRAVFTKCDAVYFPEGHEQAAMISPMMTPIMPNMEMAPKGVPAV
jgi:hypothetical protein